MILHFSFICLLTILLSYFTVHLFFVGTFTFFMENFIEVFLTKAKFTSIHYDSLVSGSFLSSSIFTHLTTFPSSFPSSEPKGEGTSLPFETAHKGRHSYDCHASVVGINFYAAQTTFDAFSLDFTDFSPGILSQGNNTNNIKRLLLKVSIRNKCKVSPEWLNELWYLSTLKYYASLKIIFYKNSYCHIFFTA